MFYKNWPITAAHEAYAGVIDVSFYWRTFIFSILGGLNNGSVGNLYLNGMIFFLPLHLSSFVYFLKNNKIKYTKVKQKLSQ